MASPERVEHFRETVILLSRFAACTPHSADVERCVSSNNLLKTNLRSNLSLLTENKYLFIYFNLPPLEKWSPKKAVIKWDVSKDRRKTDTTTSKLSVHRQPHFKGVFEIESVDDDEDEDAEDGDILTKFQF